MDVNNTNNSLEKKVDKLKEEITRQVKESGIDQKAYREVEAKE